jgi:hypothetical protein
VRDDQVFGKRFCVTTDGVTSTVDSFSDEDFFSDIRNLYISDMTEEANFNMNLNLNPHTTPYTIFSYLF